MKIKFNKDQLNKYFSRQNDVEFALLFGSVATNRTTALSDIDIAVYFKGEQGALKLAERQTDITCDIMRICHINEVDAVVLNTANPFLAFQTIKYGRLIYASDEKAFYRFKANAFGRYQDIRSMYDLYDMAAEVNLRRGI